MRIVGAPPSPISPLLGGGMNPMNPMGGLTGLNGMSGLGPGLGQNPFDRLGLSPELNGLNLAQQLDPVQIRVQQLQQEIQQTQLAMNLAQDPQQKEQLQQRLIQLQQELQQLLGQGQGQGDGEGGPEAAGAPQGGAPGGDPGGGAPQGGAPTGGAPAGGAPQGGAPAGGAPAGGTPETPPAGGAPQGGDSPRNGTPRIGRGRETGDAGQTNDAPGGPGTANAVPNPQLSGDDQRMAQAIEQQLRGTPLEGRGLGQHFVNAGRQQNVDPLALVAISRHETRFGALGVGVRKHMGVGAYDRNPNGRTPYDGAVQQIYSGARTFNRLRARGGSNASAPMSQQLAAVNRAGWATDRNWHRGVGRAYNTTVAQANRGTGGNTQVAQRPTTQPSRPASTPQPTRTASR